MVVTVAVSDDGCRPSSGAARGEAADVKEALLHDPPQRGGDDDASSQVIPIGVPHSQSGVGDEDDLGVKCVEGGNLIWWGLFFCNMATMWAYQTLMTAQDVYVDKFPNADISFWGTVSYGIALVLSHVVQLALGIEKYLSFQTRVVTGFVLTIILGIVVILVEKPGVVIAAFAIIGMLNTFICAPLYAIAGLFPTGVFTGAVNIGNAWAGVLTVFTEVAIRLLYTQLGPKDGDVHDFTFKCFTGIMAGISAIAIVAFLYTTRRVDACRRKIHATEATRLADSQSFSIDWDRLRMVRQTIWDLRYPAIAQFWIFFISLTLWPGIPCATGRRHWFKHLLNYRSGDWLCTPFIIGAFNIGDFLGRLSPPFFAWMSMKACMGWSFARTAVVPLVVICVRPHLIDSNWVLIATIFVMAWTNGLLCTLSMMKGPMMVRNPEIGAYVMVLFLYLGIAVGAITAAIINKKGWPGEGLT